jgi:hypothetical protein
MRRTICLRTRVRGVVRLDVATNRTLAVVAEFCLRVDHLCNRGRTGIYTLVSIAMMSFIGGGLTWTVYSMGCVR